MPCCARCVYPFSAMPHQTRLDVPDTVHHLMVRGLERRVIFRDGADRVAAMWERLLAMC